ncbi:MAG: M56 family metallopeptidase [Pirellulaceae bacterium]
MNPFIESLLWCIVQVTLVGLLATSLCAALSRWGTGATAAVPAVALAAVVALTASAFVPWPSGWRYGPQWKAATASAVDLPEASDEAAPLPADDDVSLLAAPLPFDWPATIDEQPAMDPADVAPPVASETASSPIAATSTLAEQLWSWLPAALTAVLAAGVVLGLLQLAGGLLSVRRFRRASQPLFDAELAELADCLCAELSLARGVELRESEHLATAATVGWSRPVVLLPCCWRGWTCEQRRAVLAHELAHVARGDYLACVLAQLSVAIHFYHPLVHWLAARLRLEQELAADATAAQLAGGRRNYLQSLAELALHTPEQPLGWPAHTFLPTQGTFLRRIEMLRDSKLAAGAVPRPHAALRWGAVGLLVIGAVLAAGLRGQPAGSPLDAVASAQDTAEDAAKERDAPQPTAGNIDLSHVPNDAKMLLAIRPAQLMQHSEVRSALEAATVGSGPALLKLMATKNLRQLTVIGPAGVEPDDWDSDIVVVVQFSEPTTFEAISEAGAWPKGARRLPSDERASGAAQEKAYAVLDERTLALGSAKVLPRYLANRRKGAPVIAAGEAWEKVKNGAIVAALDMQPIREQFRAARPGSAAAGPFEALTGLAPLWTDSEYLLAGAIVEGKTVHLRAIATCQDGKLAENVADTTQAALTMARNGLRSLREREADIPEFIGVGMEMVEGLLKSVAVERTDKLVVAQTKTAFPEAGSAVAGKAIEAISKARDAARRSNSANNMKQIALGLHNWADTYGGRFPPPVVMGRNGRGGVPHSWRVALLPFVEQAALYEAYNFDEPWDSETNKKVLAQMPPQFRHPLDDPESTNAGYFVLRSEMLLAEPPEEGFATAFSGKNGMPFSHIHDGMSNTLAVVEARRDIPWTKPEDILFDPDAKELPKLGGWFKGGYNVALCDGAVKFLDEQLDPKTLKLLIMPQDGQQVPQY